MHAKIFACTEQYVQVLCTVCVRVCVCVCVCVEVSLCLHLRVYAENKHGLHHSL